MFLATPRVNVPYSFAQDKLNVSADYSATATTRASVGYEHDVRKRTFQEADTTREQTVWGKIASRAVENADLSLKLAHGERRHSGYAPVVVGVVPLENPLLRKYNLANRTRDSAIFRADLSAIENVSIGLGASASSDDYTDSAIGLTRGSDLSLSGDIAVALTERTSVHAFANRERIKSRQAGSQTVSSRDWIGENEDTIDFYGIGLKHAAIPGKLDVGADYGYMRTRSEIAINTGSGNGAFPDMSSKLQSFKLYASYKLKDNMSLNASVWRERFDSANWMLDGVTPTAIPNVLTLGEVPPRYSLNFVRLSVRYKF
jgi:MtrB/PioB family decaheme-associated outer membrane protein